MVKKFKYTIAIMITLIIFVWIIEIVNGGLPYVDQWTRPFVIKLNESKLYYFFRGMTELGSRSFLIPFTIAGSLLLWIIFRDWLPAIILSGGTLMTHLINMLVKILIARERPSIWIEANAEGYSFPSGHSMITIACYGLFVYFVSQKITSNKMRWIIKVFFSCLILFIGISRYVINVHYLTDILAGFSIGFGCLLVFIHLNIYINKRRSQT